MHFNSIMDRNIELTTCSCLEMGMTVYLHTAMMFAIMKELFQSALIEIIMK